MDKLSLPTTGLVALCPSLEARWQMNRNADPLYLAAVNARNEGPEALVRLEASLPAEVRMMKRQGWAQAGSVAVVPLVGVLQKDGDFWSRYTTWYSSMRDFTAVTQEAARSRGIKSILAYIDSPGGTVDGTPEAADALAALVDSGVPVVSYASGMMASAAYYIGSQAGAIFSDRSADIGSIGVRWMFVDMSKALADRGIVIDELTSGTFKGAGSPHRPMTDAERAYFQASVDASAAEFYASVESGRMTKKRINPMSAESFARVTSEAGVYDPKTALSLGLIDGIASIQSVIADLNRL